MKKLFDNVILLYRDESMFYILGYILLISILFPIFLIFNFIICPIIKKIS